MDAIVVNEIISGGPAWRANELEVGDHILKVKQEDEVNFTDLNSRKGGLKVALHFT